jgi:hypothetical protein
MPEEYVRRGASILKLNSEKYMHYYIYVLNEQPGRYAEKA